MRHIALILSYDGSAYHGWQMQANANTVQGTLAAAITKITDTPTQPVGCGRTDSGVHARYYVASFFTDSNIPLNRFPIALNTTLPHDIVIHKAYEVPPEFHPVHSCIRKEYTYELYRDDTPNPFYHQRALFYPYPMDVSELRCAAKQFIGTHDFSSMRSLGTPVKTTVRTVYDFEIIENGSQLSFRIAANGFLYNMARTMVGTLLSVAQGKIAARDITKILESKDRALAGATAPAHGLYMTDSFYGKEYFHD